MRKFKLLKDLPGNPAGTESSEPDDCGVTFAGELRLDFTYYTMKKYPDFFQEITPEWTDDDMLEFARFSRSRIESFYEDLDDFKQKRGKNANS